MQASLTSTIQRGRIKGWAITVVAALLALAVNSSSWLLGVIAAATVIFFAYIDIAYMAIQAKVIHRSHELEEYLEATRRRHFAIADSYVFGIGIAHRPEYYSGPALAELRKRPQVIAFYVGLALATGVTIALLGLASWMPA